LWNYWHLTGAQKLLSLRLFRNSMVNGQPFGPTEMKSGNTFEVLPVFIPNGPMRILFDINHPAHAHFFKNAISELSSAGHTTLITASSKECTYEILAQSRVEYELIDGTHDGSIREMAKLLIARNQKLRSFVLEQKPDVLAAIGGTFVAHVGRMTPAKSVVFYDTAEARLQNLITYPFVHRLVVPNCYDGWTPRARTKYYNGCHELSYLAPRYFKPSRDKAINAGLDPTLPTLLLRLVSWHANHDIGLRGLSDEFVHALVHALSGRAKLLISSEKPLPSGLKKYQYTGPPSDIHHLLAFTSGLIGESATMASESAVLGVPALLLGPSKRCYTRWLETEYGLIRSSTNPSIQNIFSIVENWIEQKQNVFHKRKNRLIENSEDVTKVIQDNILFFN